MVPARYPEACGTASEQGHLTDEEDPNPRAEPCLWIGRRVTVPEWRPERSHFFFPQNNEVGTASLQAGYFDCAESAEVSD